MGDKGASLVGQGFSRDVTRRITEALAAGGGGATRGGVRSQQRRQRLKPVCGPSVRPGWKPGPTNQGPRSHFGRLRSKKEEERRVDAAWPNSPPRARRAKVN